MALITWAIDVPHIPLQRDAILKNGANPIKLDITIRELQSETRLHEYGITSNRESPRHGESNLSWVLTTRQALKDVCAISLTAYLYYFYLISCIFFDMQFSYA